MIPEKSAIQISIVKLNSPAFPASGENYRAISELDRKIAKFGLLESNTDGVELGGEAMTQGSHKGMVKDVNWIALGPKSVTDYYIKPKRA